MPEAPVPVEEGRQHPAEYAAKIAVVQSWDLPTPVMGPNHLGVPYHLAQVHSPATDHPLLEEVEWLRQDGRPNKLFLPKANGGLDLPELTTVYKKLHAAKAANSMCSRDSMVRGIATQKTLQERHQKRPAFHPYTQVVEAMKEDPGANRRTITRKVKARVQAEDTTTRLTHSTQLAVQGQTVRDFEGKDAEAWTSVVLSLPELTFKFALNSTTDTLPYNKNLCLWKKLKSPSCPLCGRDQTLLHILNNCSVALEKRRCTERHDSVLSSIHSFLVNHLPQGMNIMADLPDMAYTFPPHVAQTEERLDIVAWNDKAVYLVELTIPF